MTVAILDTTVIVHLYRRYPPAIAWFNTNQVYSITSITWMEIMVGVPNKRVQIKTLELLGGFRVALLDGQRSGLGDAANRTVSIQSQCYHK